MRRLRVTDSLDVDPDAGAWRCRNCGTEPNGTANDCERAGLVCDRDPRKARYPEIGTDYVSAPDPGEGAESSSSVVQDVAG